MAREMAFDWGAFHWEMLVGLEADGALAGVLAVSKVDQLSTETAGCAVVSGGAAAGLAGLMARAGSVVEDSVGMAFGAVMSIGAGAFSA